jgi:serine/threonine protein phosphatase PrpC
MIDAHALGFRGPRWAMEDRHVLVVRDDLVVGAVFDGHGGAAVADFAAGRLASMLDVPPGAALRRIHEASAGLSGGACAVAFRLAGELLEVANLGDTGLVRVDDRVEVLSESHRVSNPAERARVLAAGAAIVGPYVVDPFTGDGLMPTRSLGDHQFAGIGVIGEPQEWRGRFRSGWLVAACDGLWDVLSPEELPRWLVGSAEAAARGLAEEALEGRGSADNLTIIVVHKSTAPAPRG